MGVDQFAKEIHDLYSLREMFAVLNYGFEDMPVNRIGWNALAKKHIIESRIIAERDGFKICYLKSDTDANSRWQSAAESVLRAHHGQCLICTHIMVGDGWAMSVNTEGGPRHIVVPLYDDGAFRHFVRFLDAIRLESDDTVTVISKKITEAFDEFDRRWR